MNPALPKQCWGVYRFKEAMALKKLSFLRNSESTAEEYF
jgi:hypothetical protein